MAIDWVVDATVWGQASRGDNPVLQTACVDFLLHLREANHPIGVDTVGRIIKECENQLGASPDINAIWGTLIKRSVKAAQASKGLRVTLQELGVHKEDQVYFFITEQLSCWLVGCEKRWLDKSLVKEIKRRHNISVFDPKTARNACMVKCIDRT